MLEIMAVRFSHRFTTTGVTYCGDVYGESPASFDAEQMWHVTTSSSIQTSQHSREYNQQGATQLLRASMYHLS